MGHLPTGTKTIIKLSDDEPGKLREKINLAEAKKGNQEISSSWGNGRHSLLGRVPRAPSLPITNAFWFKPCQKTELFPHEMAIEPEEKERNPLKIHCSWGFCWGFQPMELISVLSAWIVISYGEVRSIHASVAGGCTIYKRLFFHGALHLDQGKLSLNMLLHWGKWAKWAIL